MPGRALTGTPRIRAWMASGGVLRRGGGDGGELGMDKRWRGARWGAGRRERVGVVVGGGGNPHLRMRPSRYHRIVCHSRA